MDSADRKEYVHEFINAPDAMHLARCKVPFYTAAKGIEVVAARDSCSPGMMSLSCLTNAHFPIRNDSWSGKTHQEI